MISYPDDVVGAVIHARSVCVLTGAGVSAESGVPTFRGNDGLWKRFRPEELANVQAFLLNPDLVWEWYQYRRKLLEECKPNAAHSALARMEALFADFLLVTQNVDGLHEMAGSRNVARLHGSIRHNKCQSCGVESDADVPAERSGIPVCTACGGLLRPAVVWFGEALPMDAFARAEKAAKSCDLFFLIGTSGVVYPAASLPFTAKDAGAYLLEINPEETDLTRYTDYSVRARAAEALPELLLRLEQAQSDVSATGRKERH